MLNLYPVYVGHDAREQRAFDVCTRSLQGQSSQLIAVQPISRHTLGAQYTRETTLQHSRLWDGVSNAPMSTDFSLARFWVPALAGRAGWALFVDCDFLFRADVAHLFAAADPRYAVQVVKHVHEPREHLKMDNQIQTRYPRKNWSSCMLFNLSHAAHRRLDQHALNERTGLWLHQFSWLQDHEIGDLDPDWNVLDGQGARAEAGGAKAYHYTRGTPDIIARDMPYTSEWWGHLTQNEIARWEAECKPANSATA